MPSLFGFESLEVRVLEDLTFDLSAVDAGIASVVDERAGEPSHDFVHARDARQEIALITRVPVPGLVTNDDLEPELTCRVEDRDERAVTAQHILVAVE